MSEAYERVKGGRLTFKGGALASRSKSIDKKKKKKQKKSSDPNADFTEEILTGDAATAAAEEGGGSAVVEAEAGAGAGAGAQGGGGDDDIYTIDAAKKMKYDDLFPVEARKFGYDPKAKVKSVEGALDDRVKKKADRYCK